MTNSKEKLFSDFSSVSTQEWLDKIQVDLKGADFDKKLVWKTTEGFKVQPFYRKDDLKGLKTTEGLPGEYPYVRGIKKDDNTWYVRQDIQVKDAKESNAKALDLLNKGVDSLGFLIKEEDICAEFIHTLLKDIHCDCIELNFSTCQKSYVVLAELLIAYFKEKGYDPNRLVGSINYDPISLMMLKGKDLRDTLGFAKRLVELLTPYPFFRCINVNAIELNNAGSYCYQELGYALAWGNEYLNWLIEAGIPAALAARKIKFNFGISSNYFMEIAKFRAARLLWADIVKEYLVQETNAEDVDLEPAKMIIHAETSQFNLTLFDAYVNLLRTQTEAMSAALAGVHSMSVVPFNMVYETPTNFSERIARNQQLLLKEEAHFNRIVDPAAGSYYIENLTDSLGKEAWKLFLATEDEGGMLTSVLNSQVQNAINTSNSARHEAVSKRKEILLGTNQYPNFNEISEGRKPLQIKSTSNFENNHQDQSNSIAQLNTARAASDFEALRLQTETLNKRPIAFMLTIGNLAMRQARAQFSCNFLACAGYKVIDNLGFETVEEGVKAAINADADIIVLCSSDEEYSTYAIPAFQNINGRAIFIVAGAPACMDELKAAGIENFIHVRCNVLDTLRTYNKKLGIK